MEGVDLGGEVSKGSDKSCLFPTMFQTNWEIRSLTGVKTGLEEVALC